MRGVLVATLYTAPGNLLRAPNTSFIRRLIKGGGHFGGPSRGGIYRNSQEMSSSVSAGRLTTSTPNNENLLKR